MAEDVGSGMANGLQVGPESQLFVKHLFYEELKCRFLYDAEREATGFYWNGRFFGR